MFYTTSRTPAQYTNAQPPDTVVQRVQEASDRDGHKLSPVDLTLSEAKELQLPPLSWTHYGVIPSTMTVRNSGFTVMINASYNQESPYVSCGPLTGDYNFSQIHFHWGEHNETGSAHSVNGVRYPLEMHVVHLKKHCANLGDAFNSKDGIAVMVHLFGLQEDRNPHLDQLTAILQFIQKPKTCARLYPIPLEEIVHPFSDDYYMYWGAVASPKGQYRILWLISRNVLPISSQQLDEFRQLHDPQGKLLTSNSRKPHPLAGRSLFIVSPADRAKEPLYGISHHPNQSLTALESEDSYDIGSAEYKSLVAFDEIEDCKVCQTSKTVKQNVNVGQPFEVNKGNTSVEESVRDSSDSSEVTFLTEMNAKGKKVVTNVNVTSCRRRYKPANSSSPSEAVYSVISIRGSELHLRRRPSVVRQNEPSTELACMMLSNSMPVSRSYSAPTLSRPNLVTGTEMYQSNRNPSLLEYTGDNCKSMYGLRKTPEAVSKSNVVKMRGCPDTQSLTQDQNQFSNVRAGSSNNNENYDFTRSVLTKNNDQYIYNRPDPSKNNDEYNFNRSILTKNNDQYNYNRPDPSKNNDEYNFNRSILTKNNDQYNYNRPDPSKNNDQYIYNRSVPSKNNDEYNYNRTFPSKNNEDFNLNTKGVSKNIDEFHPNRFNSGENEYQEFYSEVNDTTENIRREKYTFVKRTQKNNPEYVVRQLPRAYIRTQMNELDQNNVLNNKEQSSRDQYIVKDPTINNNNQKQAMEQSKSFREIDNGNNNQRFIEPTNGKMYPPNVYSDKTYKDVFINRDNPFRMSCAIPQGHQTRNKNSSRKQTVKTSEKTQSHKPQRESAKTDSCYKVSLLVRTTVSDHSRPGKRKGIAKQYVVTKISPIEKSITVIPKDTSNGSKNCSVRQKVKPDNEIYYYAKPLNEEMDPGLDLQIQDNNRKITIKEEHSRYNDSDEEEPSVNGLNDRFTVENPERGKCEKNVFRDGNMKITVNYKIPNDEKYVNNPTQRGDQYVYNKELHEEETTEFESRETKDKVIVHSHKREVNKNTDEQIRTISKDLEKNLKSQYQLNMNNVILNDPGENLYVDERTKAKIRDKYESTDVVTISKRCREEKPHKTEDFKQFNYEIVKSKHPETQFYVKEPSNRSQPVVVAQQNLTVDEQVKGNSEMKHTTEYDNRPLQSTSNNYDKHVYNNITETHEDISEEDSSKVIKTFQKKYFIQQKVQQEDPGKSLLNNQNLQKTTYSNIPEGFVENIPERAEGLNKPAKSFYNEFGHGEVNVSEVEDSSIYEKKISDSESDLNKENISRQVLQDNLNFKKTHTSNTTVEYEEVVEENTFTCQETKKNLKYTYKSGDKVFKIPIQKSTGPNEVPSNNLITIKKIEIPEPHYVTRVPKQPPVEYEAYPVDPHQPFEIMTETLEEMTSIVKTNKTFMMFKKINGKAVLNQPSIIKPMKLETDVIMNSQPGTKNNSFARSFIEDKLLVRQLHQKVWEDGCTIIGKEQQNDLKKEKPSSCNNNLRTQSNIAENIMKNDNSIKETTETKLDGFRASTENKEYPKQETIVKDTNPYFTPDDVEERFIGYNYPETTLTSKRKENECRIQKILAMDQLYPVVDNQGSKPFNEIFEQHPNVEENKSHLKELKGSFEHPQPTPGKLQSFPTTGKLATEDKQQYRRQPQNNFQSPKNITKTEEYYESHVEDFKKHSTQKHVVSTSRKPTIGNLSSTKLRITDPKEMFTTGYLANSKKPMNITDGFASTGNKVNNDRIDTQFDNFKKKVYNPQQKYPPQPLNNRNVSEKCHITNESVNKNDGDIVIYIRQPNRDDENISPRITVDIGEAHKMTESELESQKVKVYETNKQLKDTYFGSSPILPRRSKSEQYHRRSGDDVKSDSSQEIETTHYNLTLKSETPVELPADRKSQVKSKTHVVIEPLTYLAGMRKPVGSKGTKSKVDECCSSVDVGEAGEFLEDSSDLDATEFTSYEEDLGSETSFNHSPIKIQSYATKIQALPKINFFNHWDAKGDALMENNGKTLCVTPLEKTQLPYITGGPLKGVYEFYELHFHWGYKDCCGAEHIVDGQRNTIEAHFLYIKKAYEDLKEAVKHTDGIAIVAVCLIVGNPPNEQFGNLIKDMPLVREADTGTYVAAEHMFGWIKCTIDSAKGYYWYRGSLSAEPPHVESVAWMVFPDPVPFCCQQSSEFRKLKSSKGELLTKNFRPPQPLNNRTVYFVPISHNV